MFIYLFRFNEDEKIIIDKLVQDLKDSKRDIDFVKEKNILEEWKMINGWFRGTNDRDKKLQPGSDNEALNAPEGARNMLGMQLKTAKLNKNRPKNGYRYESNIKRFWVQNRMLAGRSAFNLLQGNLKGCVPSIWTADRYIRRGENMTVEGKLRCEELLMFLKERNQPLYVILSEDASRVNNRIQYDSRTNQVKIKAFLDQIFFTFQFWIFFPLDNRVCTSNEQ